ncbi:MAG: 50S ribosomal protein L6 [Elusimicrobia bacterium RIFCSPLOWO2_02_FULL_39_32]|nr:MAG: 50S ribosomal protein L6 [Elusimicrobia bacterium RIFCSPHIGHO2_02_FULL_39_36]OGR93741.1 MAG: 50S ribosomal protein L6 [Elusimicrobia bacterium RIFCSPLOWO2_02_FULL_39_32]OGS00957.1 MAG: 50S ribosomal protein L6 [Elusimicrobia bacterium RIFCSPLOWO2_12_FULL_39_28]
MSRIGKKLINIPDKVSVQVQDASIEVKGPLGVLAKKIPQGITVEVKGKEIHVLDSAALPQSHALHGLMRTLIANMVQGVVQPWKKDLEIQGVGYRAAKNGQILNLQVGYSHPVNFKIPDIVQFNVDAKQTQISFSSPDKEILGNLTAKIRSIRKPEPYKGKGIRYVGERVTRKAGKAAGAVGSAGGGGAKK